MDKKDVSQECLQLGQQSGLIEWRIKKTFSCVKSRFQLEQISFQSSNCQITELWVSSECENSEEWQTAFQSFQKCTFQSLFWEEWEGRSTCLIKVQVRWNRNLYQLAWTIRSFQGWDDDKDQVTIQSINNTHSDERVDSISVGGAESDSREDYSERSANDDNFLSTPSARKHFSEMTSITDQRQCGNLVWQIESTNTISFHAEL